VSFRAARFSTSPFSLDYPLLFPQIVALDQHAHLGEGAPSRVTIGPYGEILSFFFFFFLLASLVGTRGRARLIFVTSGGGLLSLPIR